MVESTGGRPPGPTDETANQVLQAAFRLLSTEGPAALTPVRIHKETGVARTTVYRHWPTPRHLLLGILRPATRRHEVDSLVGEVEADLHTAVATLTTRFETRPVRAFHDGLRVHDDGDESPRLSERYIQGLIAPARDVIATSIERGELQPGDIDQLVLELCGPLLAKFMLLGQPIEAAETKAAIANFLQRHRSPASAE